MVVIVTAFIAWSHGGVDDVNYTRLSLRLLWLLYAAQALVEALSGAKKCWFRESCEIWWVSKLCKNARYNGCSSRRETEATLRVARAHKPSVRNASYGFFNKTRKGATGPYAPTKKIHESTTLTERNSPGSPPAPRARRGCPPSRTRATPRRRARRRGSVCRRR